MPFNSKFWKYSLEASQFTFGIIGGFLFYFNCLVAFFIKPMRKIVGVYKDGAPIYSTLILSIISVIVFILALYLMSFYLADVGFFPNSSASIKEVTIGILFLFFMLLPWFFLSLDLFAYYKRFRRDRKK
jgi:Na+/melibiose symporter-like transporter